MHTPVQKLPEALDNQKQAPASMIWAATQLHLPPKLACAFQACYVQEEQPLLGQGAVPSLEMWVQSMCETVTMIGLSFVA